MLVIICAYNKKILVYKKKKMCVREREITFVLL